MFSLRLSVIVFLLNGVAWTQPSTPPDLASAQTLIDSGRISDAERAVRSYITGNQVSADAHYLLAYILFRETNPKASLAEYAEGAKYRSPDALDLTVEGCDYFLTEDYSAAAQDLTKSIELDPKDALAHYYLGRTNYNRKRFEPASKSFAECLSLDPRNIKAANYLGLSLQELGRLDDAETAYRKAVAIDEATQSHYPEPWRNLGALLAENGKAADALPFLQHAIDADPGNFEAQKALGKAFLLLQRFGEAQAALEKAVKLAPQNAPVHFLLARAYRSQGLAAQAKTEEDHYAALTAQHSSPDSPLVEARSLIKSGKVSEAEQAVRTYLSANSTSAEAHYLLGYILFKRQQPKDSLAEYTEGAKYRAPTAADLEAVASDYILLKDYPDADKWFTKAVEWNPKDGLGWYYLGRTKYNENRFDEAVDAFHHCLELEPKNVKAEDNLGLSYEGLNKIEEATAAYRTAIQWQANSLTQDANPYLDLGTLLTGTGSEQEALSNLQRAAQLAPEDYRVHRELGKLYSRLEQLGKAREELEKAIQLAQDNAPLHFMLAQVYRKLGMVQQAQLETNRYTALTGTNSQ